MQVVQVSGAMRLVLCGGVAALALAGGARAQAYYPGDYPPPPAPAYAPGYDYPAPPPGYAPQGYPAPRYADPRAAAPQYAQPDDRYRDPRYADPSYESYQDPRAVPPRYADPRAQDPRAQDPRAADPRYADPREARAYARWAARYYGPAYASAYPPAPRYAPPALAAYADAPAPVAPVPPAPVPAPLAAPAVAPAPVPAVEAPAAPPAPVAAPEAAAQPAKVVVQAQAVVPHLPHRLVEAAQAYADYVKKTTAISAAFKSGATVAEAVKTGSGYEMHQFEEGAIAYAALTALQEPEFVQGVQSLLAEGDQGALFADQLAMQPQAALNIRGADLAAARAAAALHRHGQHLVSVGAQVKQAAYDVQHSEWSKAQVSDPDGRLANAKTISGHRIELKGDEAPELTKAVLAETMEEGRAAPSPVVTRGLAIAALAVLGQLHGDEDNHLFTLLNEPKSADCLKMAKLNLFQCLSVSRPHYEDIFCLGEHAMMETGQCVVKAAGYTPVPVTVARAGTTEAARK